MLFRRCTETTNNRFTLTWWSRYAATPRSIGASEQERGYPTTGVIILLSISHLLHRFIQSICQ